MKKFRFAALLTTLALALVMPFAVAEETIDPAQLMEDVAGTYVPPCSTSRSMTTCGSATAPRSSARKTPR